MPLIRLLRALWFRAGTCLPGTAKPPSASTARVNALAITADPQPDVFPGSATTAILPAA